MHDDTLIVHASDATVDASHETAHSARTAAGAANTDAAPNANGAIPKGAVPQRAIASPPPPPPRPPECGAKHPTMRIAMLIPILGPPPDFLVRRTVSLYICDMMGVFVCRSVCIDIDVDRCR